jgi:hypothetical protein
MAKARAIGELCLREKEKEQLGELKRTNANKDRKRLNIIITLSAHVCPVLTLLHEPRSAPAPPPVREGKQRPL